LAHSGAKGIVKTRMDAMSDIGRNMKLIGTMLKSNEIDVAALKKAATEIQDHAVGIPNMFPEDSFDAVSEASPEILNDREGFDKFAEEMKLDAAKLAELVSSSADKQALKAQFTELAYSCSGCHEKFRIKK